MPALPQRALDALPAMKGGPAQGTLWADGQNGYTIFGVENEALSALGGGGRRTPLGLDSFGFVIISPFLPITIGPPSSSASFRAPNATSSSTYTAAANGPTQSITGTPMKYFSIQVVATGAVTSWDVRLEVSLDGTAFSQAIQHTNADGTGIVKPSVAIPARAFRSRCAGIVLGGGTNVVVTIQGIE